MDRDRTPGALTIPLSRPDLSDVEIRSMIESVSAGAIARGALAQQFEAELARALGARGGVATNSGTSALVLALRVLDVGPGDEVIAPTYTCLAILNAVIQCGATPVLIDNQCAPTRMDYNVDARHVAPALTPRTRAIVLPHMFGVAGDVASVQALGVPVIEDITQAVGARATTGSLAGAAGPLVVCSFHASKLLVCGEGGMLLSNDAEALARARYLNGWEDEQVAQRFGAPLIPYTLRYSFRLSDVHAACGLSQLARLPDMTRRRQELANEYASALKGVEGVILPDVSVAGGVYSRFIVFSERGMAVEVLRAFAAVGIEAGRGVFPPLHHFLGLSGSRFPGAETAIRGAVSIPLYSALGDEEVDRILSAAVRIFRALAAGPT